MSGGQNNAADEAKEAAPASFAVSRWVQTLSRLSGVLSTLLILLILVLVLYAICQRYILDTPLVWGDEVLGYLLVAAVMFGAAEALRRNDHISIDIASKRLPKKFSPYLTLWSYLAVVLFSVVLGWSTWKSITFAYDFGSYSAGHIEIATWIPEVPMFLGAILIGLVAISRLLETLAGAADQ